MQVAPGPDPTAALVNAAGPFRTRLLGWSALHFRAFPWRLTSDPYAVLMAEVMLHRTQAVQVAPIFQEFMTRYPDVMSLARSDPDMLEAVLRPLGLRWRTALVHDMALVLTDRFQGQIPIEKQALLSLPGVSEYIASAVRCFAWNQPEALVDTNTVRVVGRLSNIPTKDSSRRNSAFGELVRALVDPDEPRAYNFALLDLAQTICLKRVNPLCLECPVLGFCEYGRQRTGSDGPQSGGSEES